MNYEYYHRRLNTDAIGRYDVTPLFAEREVFSNLVTDLLAPLPDDCTHVVGIEALGFVLGGAVARAADLGFVPVRKGGKLPLREVDVLRHSLTDYSDESKTLELARNLVDGDTRAFLVDDWIETGAQMRAATALVEAAGGTVVGISVLRAHRDGRTRGLFDEYPVHAIG